MCAPHWSRACRSNFISGNLAGHKRCCHLAYAQKRQLQAPHDWCQSRCQRPGNNNNHHHHQQQQQRQEQKQEQEQRRSNSNSVSNSSRGSGVTWCHHLHRRHYHQQHQPQDGPLHHRRHQPESSFQNSSFPFDDSDPSPGSCGSSTGARCMSRTCSGLLRVHCILCVF